MRWAPIVEKPERDGQYFVWSDRLGRVVMGYRDGSWGGQAPQFWLASDQCKHQNPDGSF
jgi:hypothetical protein